jgi:hypothetical protein
MWIAGAGGGRRSRLHPFILFLVDDDKQANLISTRLALILLVFSASLSHVLFHSCVVPLEEPLVDNAAARRKKGLETKETVCEVKGKDR